MCHHSSGPRLCNEARRPRACRTRHRQRSPPRAPSVGPAHARPRPGARGAEAPPPPPPPQAQAARLALRRAGPTPSLPSPYLSRAGERAAAGRVHRPTRTGITPLRPAEAAPLRSGRRLRPPRPPQSHTPPRVPSRAVGLQTAQRLKRSRCSRRGAGSFPLQRCLLATDSAGPALRITLRRQNRVPHAPEGRERRKRAKREGRIGGDRGCRDQSSRDGSALERRFRGNFQTLDLKQYLQLRVSLQLPRDHQAPTGQNIQSGPCAILDQTPNTNATGSQQ
ncbi:serine/arginine repetitive matrix protein 1-like [Pongo pygmaeus]|uniref:serine/arginine repetitive matrix protein 1-like n=1 Tax=Pongo pygmaeus TaxID=9600 RepID=UPI0023E1EC81|nr:serine/arginine repetitive matrix protein 1-like [Pongo pygmaeus]